MPFPGYDRRFGGVSTQRSPINFGFGIGIPDRQYDYVLLAIIDNGFWWRANVQGSCRQGLVVVKPQQDFRRQCPLIEWSGRAPAPLLV
jgi:hypothetical protein